LVFCGFRLAVAWLRELEFEEFERAFLELGGGGELLVGRVDCGDAHGVADECAEVGDEVFEAVRELAVTGAGAAGLGVCFG
jgi:hypothetical protein